MQADSDEALVENGVYTIATGAGDEGTGHVLLSTTVLVKAARCEILWPVTAGADAL